MQKIIEKVYLLTLCLAVAIFCYKIKLVPIFIGISLIFWIFSKQYIGFKRKLKNTSFYLPIIFYFIFLVGMLYTTNTKYGFKDLESKLSFILFPILLINSPVVEKNWKMILKSFIFGAFFICCLFLFFAYKNCYHIVDGKEIFNLSAYYPTYSELTLKQHFLSETSYFTGTSLITFNPLVLGQNLHHSYFSMYMLFAFSVSIFFVFKIKGIVRKIPYFFLSSFFLFFVVLMCSRAGYVALTFVLFFISIYLIYYQNKFLVLKIIFPIVLFFCLFGTFKIIKDTRISTNIAFTKKEFVEKNKSDVRVTIWRSGVDLIKTNFLLGVGTGDIKDELAVIYKRNNCQGTVFNCHNQYIQNFATLGIFGFLSLLALIFVPMFYSVKQKSLLLFLFLTNVSVNLLFESMFERMFGIIFFAFFYSILINTLHKNE